MALHRYESVEAAVKGCFGRSVEIAQSSRTAQSDINSTKSLYLSNGETVFLKINTIDNSGFFDAEEEGLAAIAETGTIKTPQLFAKGVDLAKGISFLMMEVIDRGNVTRNALSRMGHAFARMHKAQADAFVPKKRYGFLHDNYIGASRQINTPKDSWIDFFRECRLEPQFRMADNAFGISDRKRILRLLDRLDELLIEPDQPSLLHGDMWGGNHLINRDEEAVLIDPAVYVGHAEADLAMTEMFRPLPREFYEAYYEENPMLPGYKDRRSLYNLYHELNHHNLFGGGYLYSVLDTIMHYT